MIPGAGPVGRPVPPNIGRVTPQSKLLEVNKQLGNVGIGNQQGTTRSLFDTIPLDGRDVFNFFKQPNTGLAGIGTNVDAQNGLLGVGESLVVQWIDFEVIVIDPGTGSVLEFESPEFSSLVPSAFTRGFYAGTFEFITSNNVTMKPVSTKLLKSNLNPSQLGVFNPNTFKLLTDQVVPPLLPWTCRVVVPEYGGAIADTFLRCTITGVGSILNTQTNY